MRKALRNIRAMGGRLLVVAVLAIALIGGSVTVSNPSDASAARYTCEQAYALGQAWATYGDVMYAYGYLGAATSAYAKASVYFNYC
jgi:hypothetical protein